MSRTWRDRIQACILQVYIQPEPVSSGPGSRSSDFLISWFTVVPEVAAPLSQFPEEADSVWNSGSHYWELSLEAAPSAFPMTFIHSVHCINSFYAEMSSSDFYFSQIKNLHYSVGISSRKQGGCITNLSVLLGH